METQLRSVGRYNQELLEKYEPESPSDDGEEDDEGTDEEEEICIISSVPSRKKVVSTSEEGEGEQPSTEATSVMLAPTELAVESVPEKAEVAASRVAEHGGSGSQVETVATGRGDGDEPWLDTIAVTPLATSVVAGMEGRSLEEPAGGKTSGEDVAKEDAPRSTPSTGISPASTTTPSVVVATAHSDGDLPQYTVVRAGDSVVEGVPRICEDAQA